MEQHGQGLGFEGVGASVKTVAMVLGFIFVVTMGVVVAKRMSAEAMAVVVGIVCGVAAGIPTAVLLFVVLTGRQRARLEENARQDRRAGYPPVVVIQGGGQPAQMQGLQAGYWPAPQAGPPAERQFQVLGDDLFVDS